MSDQTPPTNPNPISGTDWRPIAAAVLVVAAIVAAYSFFGSGPTFSPPPGGGSVVTAPATPPAGISEIFWNGLTPAQKTRVDEVLADREAGQLARTVRALQIDDAVQAHATLLEGVGALAEGREAYGDYIRDRVESEETSLFDRLFGSGGE